MVDTATRSLTFAHSPDPDDAFMFYGFASGAIKLPGYDVKPHMQDIESLNQRAMQGEFEITAVSAHAYAYCSDRYAVMSCGASVGRGYGPILVGPAQQSCARIAVPGRWTTAVLTLDLWLKENNALKVEKVWMPFDQILPAVVHREVDAGLIIHEGQLTYAQQRLNKLWDAGQWWQAKTGLPLPLGLAVVRRNLGPELMNQIDQAFRQSILYAQQHYEEAKAYALQYGRGLNTDLGRRFIDMYVNDDTLNQGGEVKAGLEQLYHRAHDAGLIPQAPQLTFIV